MIAVGLIKKHVASLGYWKSHATTGEAEKEQKSLRIKYVNQP